MSAGLSNHVIVMALEIQRGDSEAGAIPIYLASQPIVAGSLSASVKKEDRHHREISTDLLSTIFIAQKQMA